MQQSKVVTESTNVSGLDSDRVVGEFEHNSECQIFHSSNWRVMNSELFIQLCEQLNMNQQLTERYN